MKHLSIRFKWALYDWANSAFSTTVAAAFFPLFFKEYWASGLPSHQSTFYLGLGHSLSGALLVILSPWLGAYATNALRRQKGLVVTVLLACITLIFMFFIPKGYALWALGLFIFSSFCFTASFIFYDALIINITKPNDYDRASSYGYALGYLGGGLLFLIHVLMVTHPEMFGLSDSFFAVRLSIASVAVWWFLFSLPLFLAKNKEFIAEAISDQDPPLHRLKKSSQGLILHLIDNMLSGLIILKKNKKIALFLLAYFFYIEAVNTTMRMAVDYGLSIGLNSHHLIKALVIAQFVGFPMAIVFGRIAEKKGALWGIFLALFVYLLTSLYAQFITTETEFYLMAIAIGCVQGGVQALSRSHYAQLIPQGQAGLFFGFYNMLGRFSAVLGPLLIGLISLFTASPRVTALVWSLFFVFGLIFLIAHKRLPCQ